MALTRITSDGITDGAIATADLANDAVTTDKINSQAVTSAKIAPSSVSTNKIVDSAVTSAKIADGAIVNADINASAAIAGSKIDPDFGSQLVDCGQVNVTGAQPRVRLLDSDNNPDYSLRNNNGTFEVHDDNAPNARFTIDDSKIVSKLNHDFDNGIDVTGDITLTGNLTIADSVIHSGDTNTKIRFPANDQVSIETAGSERLNVSASQFKVTVPNSAGDYVSHFNNTSLGVKFYDASGSSKFIGLAAEDSGTSTNHATFKVGRQGSAVTRAGIDGSGNFYIISGKLKIPDTIEHNDDPNTKIRFPANDTVTIETAGSERFRIDSSGNVGVGIASPTGKLHVESDSANNSDLDLLVLDGSASGFNGASDADTQYGIQFKGCSFATGGIGIQQRIGGQILFAKNGTWNAASGGGGQCKTDIIFTNSSGTFTSSPSTLAQTERMRIASSGNIGIGTASPATKLHIADSGSTVLLLEDTVQANQVGVRYKTTTADWIAGVHGGESNKWKLSNHTAFGTNDYFVVDTSGKVGINTTTPSQTLHVVGSAVQFQNTQSTYIQINTSDTHFYTAGSHPLRLGTNSIERIRLFNDGDIFLGSASVAATHGSSNSSRGLVYDSDGGTGNHPFLSVQHGSRSSGNPAHIKFQTSGNEEGSIRQSNLGFEISYNNTSDYRLKENVVDISDGITRLKTLKPRRYNWIADETNTTTDGFLAHEVMTAVPQAVTGTKDEVDENNKPVYQQIDQSKIVPLLVAALQEAIGRIEALEAK